MPEYKLTVGLEVHAELKTRTKMFCACKNDPDEERANFNICPICLGHPGTLPTINREAVRSILKVGVAIGGKLATKSEFDRKNYFYPDIPKGYQISQYKYPLVVGGELSGIKITRVHLEEDTARSTHSGDSSLVDFNRAGVPLLELVTEPVIHTAEEAARFGRELQLLLQYLGVAEANMEKGEMRVEANISVQFLRGDLGDSFEGLPLGTKVEVKNLNSFRAVERAIAFEAKRQAELLEKGEKVVQETRGWDENTQTTFSQRSKEDSHDYRYFPDPDLPKLDFSLLPDLTAEVLAQNLPTTPNQKRAKLKELFAIKESDIEVYINNPKLGDLFVESAQDLDPVNYQPLSNFITSVVAGLDVDLSSLKSQNLSQIVAMQVEGAISSLNAKTLLSKVLETGEEPRILAEKYGLLQSNDSDFLEQVIDRVLAQNQAVVAEYKSGKASALQFLIGQTMKESKGSANPSLAKELLSKKLA